MFRFKKSIPLSYERQGYIFFASRMYSELPPPAQKKIVSLCLECGKENYRALFEFVTTDAGVTAICMKHHIASETTVYRMVREYYLKFPKYL